MNNWLDGRLHMRDTADVETFELPADISIGPLEGPDALQPEATLR